MISLLRKLNPMPSRIVRISACFSQAKTTQTTQSNIIKLEKQEDWKTLVLENKNPVVVDFYAPWCGPCKRLSPLLEKHAEQLKDKVHLLMVDIDEHQEIAQKYNVEAIPNVKLFIKGVIQDEFLGLPKEERIKEMFDKCINK